VKAGAEPLAAAACLNSWQWAGTIKEITMNLRKATLPQEAIETLLRFNIRDVETLLSMLAVPSGIIAVARVLGIAPDAARDMAARLHAEFPDLEVEPVSDTFYPMGHRTPVRKDS
jgi:hypothetical protein